MSVPSIPSNPMQQAAGAQQGALAGTLGAGTVAGQTSAANIGQYMNPYTQQVIQNTQQDIMRGGQMAMNQLGAQATAANAFGGSRHGVAQGELSRGMVQRMGDVAAQQRQAGFQNAQQMAQQDIQNRMQQAAQLGALGQQSFGYGQQIQQQMAQQGQMQQALQQALIDAAKGQYAGYTGAPATSLGYMATALGASPTPTSSTSTGQQQSGGGLFDALTTAAMIGSRFMPSDVKLKTNIKKIKQLDNGINVYSWEWNEIGKKIAKNIPSIGVLAQEVQKIIPEAVMKHADGYLRVNYAHPELKGAI